MDTQTPTPLRPFDGAQDRQAQGDASPASPSMQPGTPGLRAAKILLAWSAPSYYDHPRSPRWYLIGGLIVLGVAVYGILSGAWTLTLVSLLLGGMYFLLRGQSPAHRSIRIEVDGVQFEDIFTPWTQCRDFWIVQTPVCTELRITRKTLLQGDIRIHTGEIDPRLIRSTVSQFLPLRADQREKFLDMLIRICKL